MTTILERIEEYYMSKGLSSRRFFMSIGMSGGYLNTAKKNNTTPGGEMLSTIIEKYPDIDIHYVLTGEKADKMTGYAKEDVAIYKKAPTVDELIDLKIEKRLKDLTPTLASLVLLEIDKEIADTEKKLNTAKNGENQD